jgi:soluble lytic murein transglycosylase-like protein
MDAPPKLLLALSSLVLFSAAARAEQPPRSALAPRLLAPAALLDPGLQCRQAIRAAEQAAGIPSQLMAAIARVESGRPDAQGIIHPWPWTINAEGQGQYFDSKAEAIAAVQALQARGVRSIDVGCMQVNLMHHPNAFASLDQAFDPAANAAYAARFLNQLYADTHDWVRATANYHSATPELGSDYQRKVAAVLPQELQRLGLTPVMATANVWSTNVWSQNMWNTGGGNALSNRAEAARVIPAPPGTVGRGLASYRAMPVPVATAAPRRAPL